jgi:3D-(3,5/4)-trihydroxycyclohexane-1,2-dione acylhydrolase (decyclizing)
MKLTVGQAIVAFLAAQYSERDGTEHRLIEGCFGIFGHGNVAGLGEALLEAELTEQCGKQQCGKQQCGKQQCGKQHSTLRYYQGRNEQAMVHAAVGFARMRNRLSTLACTSSVGPGATNMVTGAALATVNRLPVLLLPSDVFATRVADPVLQQLEHPSQRDVFANDAFRPVSRFFDRVDRPEQLPDALLGAMRVLADPAETGAVTICLPEDVQAQAYDWPDELFRHRVWPVPRPVPDPASVARALALLTDASRPLIVAGGGVIYSDATAELRAIAQAAGIPVAETQAGKGSLPYDHPQSVGAIGATGTTAANALAREADVVIGIGTRWSDFATASRSAFGAPGVQFINMNITSFDAAKNSGLAVIGDARAAISSLAAGLAGWQVHAAYRARATELARDWDQTVERAYHLGHSPLPAQSEVIGAVNEAAGPRDVVVCAAGSMPGDLHKLWRTRDPKGYHVEYGYSCMGYEIAGGLGVKLAAPDRDVYVMVGDGSYLMMSSELVTAVQERLPLIVVLVQNHGFASIGALSASVGSQRFGTAYRYRDPATGRLDGANLPVDLAANAQSLGATVIRAATIADLKAGLAAAKSAAKSAGGPVVIHVETDPLVPAPDSESWWDVPIAEVSGLDSVTSAEQAYQAARTRQRRYL